MKKLICIIALFALAPLLARAAAGDTCGTTICTTDLPYCVSNGISSTCQATQSGQTTTSGTQSTGTTISPQGDSANQNNSSSGFVPLTNIPGLTTGASATSAGLATFLNNLYKYLIGIAAILAVIEIIWGGLEISTQDSVSKNQDGKERIQQAILGLVLILSPVLVFTIINPSILNLSLSLAPIKLVSGGANNNSANNGGGTATDQNTQCSVSGTAGLLQFATCPSATAAQTWGQQNCPSPGLLSAPTIVTNNADGTPGQESVSCTTRNVFEFIDINTSLIYNNNVISGGVEPLAIANNSTINGSNTLYQTNGSDAIQYAQICHAAGLTTCINKNPATSISHTCNPLPNSQLPASAPVPAKCYTETLSCTQMGTVSTVTDSMCSANPNWTPVQ